VAALEREVERISQLLPAEKQPHRKDWLSSPGGVFAKDPIMKEIIEEGQKIR
jgi:hypothetical protein